MSTSSISSPQPPKIKLLKRDAAIPRGVSPLDAGAPKAPAKTIEEREQQYNEARARIFGSSPTPPPSCLSSSPPPSMGVISPGGMPTHHATSRGVARGAPSAHMQPYACVPPPPPPPPPRPYPTTKHEPKSAITAQLDPDYDRSLAKYTRVDPITGIPRPPGCSAIPQAPYEVEFPPLGKG